MADFPRDVKDRVVEFEGRYQLVLVDSQNNIYDLIPRPGNVTEDGTDINKAYLQPIENELARLNLAIFKQIWKYDVPGQYTFTAPEDGVYFLKLVGAGGSSNDGNCGGAGYAEKLVELTQGQQVIVTVGLVATTGNLAGGASSFGEYVTALGSSGYSGADAIGADFSIRGGNANDNNNAISPGSSFLSSPSTTGLPQGYGRGTSQNKNYPGTSGVVLIYK